MNPIKAARTRHETMGWGIPISIGAFLIIGFICVSYLPRGTTNCGGNNAALSECGWFATILELQFSRKSDRPITVAETSGYFRACCVARYSSWTRRARYLVFTGPIRRDTASSRTVVFVCDRPYSNVPERIFGSAPPTHAAVFSDCTFDLISPAEFASLDFTQYRDVNEMFPQAKDK